MSMPETNGRRRRTLLVGVLIGVIVPLVSFLIVVSSTSSAVAGTFYSVGTGVWALVAFSGTVMIAFDRTRRLGLGILLGFAGLLVAGAGTCTAAVVGGVV